jgi:hypothetical protein
MEDSITDVYTQVLNNIIIPSEIPLCPNESIIVIWKNKQHLQEWIDLKEQSEGIRIAKLPSYFLPMLHPDVEDLDKKTIIGIAFGIMDDYSDLSIIYSIVVESKHKKLF